MTNLDRLMEAAFPTSWGDVAGSLLARVLVGFAYGVGFALAWSLVT